MRKLLVVVSFVDNHVSVFILAGKGRIQVPFKTLALLSSFTQPHEISQSIWSGFHFLPCFSPQQVFILLSGVGGPN